MCHQSCGGARGPLKRHKDAVVQVANMLQHLLSPVQFPWEAEQSKPEPLKASS